MPDADASVLTGRVYRSCRAGISAVVRITGDGQEVGTVTVVDAFTAAGHAQSSPPQELHDVRVGVREAEDLPARSHPPAAGAGRRVHDNRSARHVSRITPCKAPVSGPARSLRRKQADTQLGHEQAAVRLAGVYAMARLADDWSEQRQVCVNVLCAYLRMPYTPGLTEPGFKHPEREVRLTIIRTIRDHLQNPTTTTTWCGLDLDLNGTTFDGGDFSNSIFSGGMVDFTGSTFSGGTVNFSRSTFSGRAINFSRTTYSGGTVDFSRTTFPGGTVNFSRSTYSGGTINFRASRFSGSTVNFVDVGVHTAASINWGPFPTIAVNEP
ncbi:hypothetical protein ABT127_30145 [Streptomyces sp. NPDC001904]|uniref:pentapeptide repeat-containing protein n=1 Tax=Streptomyces sp. NPDC001904 TaxID=3154531 RepID=UPI00332899D1